MRSTGLKRHSGPNGRRYPEEELMKYALRVVASALMLASVCVLAAATFLAVATALVVAVRAGGVWAKLAGVVVVGVLVAVALGVLRARRRARRRLAGVSVTADERPLLWVEAVSYT